MAAALWVAAFLFFQPLFAIFSSVFEKVFVKRFGVYKGFVFAICEPQSAVGHSFCNDYRTQFETNQYN
jgi:hypothetical protein